MLGEVARDGEKFILDHAVLVVMLDAFDHEPAGDGQIKLGVEGVDGWMGLLFLEGLWRR